MTTFERNIIHIYKEAGIKWLDQLPILIDSVALKHDLSELTPFDNLSFHYVLKGKRRNDKVVLKLGLDTENLQKEAKSLKFFQNHGGIQLLGEGKGYLLLQYAGKCLLKSYFPSRENEANRIAVKILQNFRQTTNMLSNAQENSITISTQFPEFKHLEEWFNIIDPQNKASQIIQAKIPQDILTLATTLKTILFIDTSNDIVLHGDFHHENIISDNEHSKNWFVIDPKGIIGNLAFDVATFIKNPMTDLLSHPNHESIIKNRITFFTPMLNISNRTLTQWCFLNSLLSWAWAVEDAIETQVYEKTTHLFKNLLDESI